MTMIIVFDPNGGFVTSVAAWIMSPTGAYTPQDPAEDDVVGIAKFGIVAKYKKGLARRPDRIPVPGRQSELPQRAVHVDGGLGKQDRSTEAPAP